MSGAIFKGRRATTLLMEATFANREEAGRRLAGQLEHYADRTDVLVLGLPRGGVPVACGVARHLHLPLDVFLVRKLGVPGFEELALGAIASGGVRVLNGEVLRALPVAPELLESITAKEVAELARRERDYRGERKPPQVSGRTVILIDDGVATGATMRAAIAALRQHEVARIVVAIPVGAAETCRELEQEADELVCLLTPESFRAVGQYYDDFGQVSDEEVRTILAQGAWDETRER